MAKRDAKEKAKFVKPPVKSEAKKEDRRPSGRTPLTKDKNTKAQRKAVLGAASRINANPENFKNPSGTGYSKGYKAVNKLAEKLRKLK